MSAVGSFVHDVAAVRVVFARGALSQVPEEVDRLGASRVLLISGGPEAQYAETVVAGLADRLAARVTEVVMHVPVDVANRASAAARGAGCDLVVSLGGGSAVGLAKAVALETSLPILAVPTTYAGSEMTSIWGLTEGARKTTGRDSRVLPRVVVYDPELTVGLPADISAASGMNALAHLVEGLYSTTASPVTALMAEEGVRALAGSLPGVVREPLDVDARSDALYGAWLAGWTLGTAGMGVHHKICHVLGGAYNLPHAATHSAVLPYAAAFNATFAPSAMSRALRALRSAGVSAESAPDGLWQLRRALGAPESLTSVGFRTSDIEEAAQLVVAGHPENPRPVDIDGVRELLAAACAGERPGPVDAGPETNREST